jgi:hypothetical protein
MSKEDSRLVQPTSCGSVPCKDILAHKSLCQVMILHNLMLLCQRSLIQLFLQTMASQSYPRLYLMLPTNMRAASLTLGLLEIGDLISIHGFLQLMLNGGVTWLGVLGKYIVLHGIQLRNTACNYFWQIKPMMGLTHASLFRSILNIEDGTAIHTEYLLNIRTLLKMTSLMSLLAMIGTLLP